MTAPVFTGSCTAIVTPCNDQGVDLSVLGALLEDQIAAGTDAVCVCGTTGEASTLSPEERRSVIDFCVRQVKGRIKVIAGTGSNDTKEALRRSKEAEDSGADALLVVTPYYNKATQTGLIRHYTYLADRVHTPIILYNVPSRTGVSFTAETYAALAPHPNIAGVKEASGDLGLVIRTRNACGDDFQIWSGNDDQVVPMMSLGAKGVISVASNLIPEVMRDMSHLCLTGNFPQAARLQLDYAPLIAALFLEVNPIPIKAAMTLAGHPVGVPRLPLCELSRAHLEQLREAMRQAGLSLAS